MNDKSAITAKIVAEMTPEEVLDAKAAYLKSHGDAPDLNFAGDRAWIEGYNFRASLAAHPAQEDARPVATLVEINGERVIDASIAFFQDMPLGTELYLRPASTGVAEPATESDELVGRYRVIKALGNNEVQVEDITPATAAPSGTNEQSRWRLIPTFPPALKAEMDRYWKGTSSRWRLEDAIAAALASQAVTPAEPSEATDVAKDAALTDEQIDATWDYLVGVHGHITNTTRARRFARAIIAAMPHAAPAGVADGEQAGERDADEAFLRLIEEMPGELSVTQLPALRRLIALAKGAPIEAAATGANHD